MSGVAEPAQRAMGAPPSLVGVAPSFVGTSLGGYPAPRPVLPVVDPAETAARARALLQSTRSTVQERYKLKHEAYQERLALRPTASVAAEMPESDPPPGWTPRRAQQPEPEMAHASGDPAFFGEPSAHDGTMLGMTSMGVSRETGSGMAGAGSAQWMNWIGKTKQRAKGVATAGDRTDDQWLKLENGVLRFFKDPYHNKVRPLRSVCACCRRCQRD